MANNAAKNNPLLQGPSSLALALGDLWGIRESPQPQANSGTWMCASILLVSFLGDLRKTFQKHNWKTPLSVAK